MRKTEKRQTAIKPVIRFRLELVFDRMAYMPEVMVEKIERAVQRIPGLIKYRWK